MGMPDCNLQINIKHDHCDKKQIKIEPEAVPIDNGVKAICEREFDANRYTEENTILEEHYNEVKVETTKLVYGDIKDEIVIKKEFDDFQCEEEKSSTLQDYRENHQIEEKSLNVAQIETEQISDTPIIDFKAQVHPCPECGKAFANKYSMSRHRKIHTDNKPHQCFVCNGVFLQKRYLRRHIKVHSQDFIRECEVCGKSVSKGAMVKHMRTHERPFKCDLCEEAFAEMSYLQAHKAMHVGHKSFKCEECGKMFYSRSSLTCHKRKHLGKGLHECHICGLKVRKGSSMRSHVMVHTGEKPFSCDVCGRGFSLRSQLGRHKNTHTKLTNIP